MTKGNQRKQDQALSERRFLTGTASTLGAARSSAGIDELIAECVRPPEKEGKFPPVL